MVMMSQLRMNRERGSSVRREMELMRARTWLTSSLNSSFSDCEVSLPKASRLLTVCCDRMRRDLWFTPP